MQISCNFSIMMVKKNIVVSQEYREGYDCYSVEHECQKREKYFIALSCGCGLPKTEVGLHGFCDMTQPKYSVCMLQGLFHQQWCRVLWGVQLLLAICRSVCPVTGDAGDGKSEARRLNPILSSWAPWDFKQFSGNSLDICLFVHSPYLTKFLNANEMSCYL